MSNKPRPKPQQLGMVPQAHEPRLICPYCGHHRIDWGQWVGGQYQDDKSEQTPQTARARKCQSCGHVALFVPRDDRSS